MICGVLQARASSTRLPGKVLAPVLGHPMLGRQIERLLRCETLDRFVVATSDDAADDPIEQLTRDMGVECFRGSLDDVLDRVYQAVSDPRPDHVVRFTGDCPLIDPHVSDAVVRFAVDGGYDFASNTLPPTFPDGLDTEVATYAALEIAWGEATLTSEREHVMPFIYSRPERFTLGNHVNAEDHSDLRWTVDTPADLEFVRAVYAELYPADPAFGFAAVLELMERRPELAALNAGQSRNEGYARSRADEAGGRGTEAEHV